MTRVGVVLVACSFIAAFVVMHALGMRDDVSVLSGTAPALDGATPASGLAYAAAWFAAVVVSPILVLAALLDAVVVRVTRARRADA